MELKDLLEEIKKPNKKDKERYKKTHPNGGTLHFVVKSEKGKTLGYVDDKYVNKVHAKSPKAAARIRLRQVEYFKKNEDIINNFSNELNESVSSQIFRFIPLGRLDNLLTTNTFNLAPSQGANKFSNKFNYLSVSRIKFGGYARNNTYKSGVILELDGRKFNNKFKGGPVDYWGKDFAKTGTKQQKMTTDENEERIFSDKNTIPNASSYIKAVHILIDKEKKFDSEIVKLRKKCALKGLSCYVYDDINAFKTLNKKKALKEHKEARIGSYKIKDIIDIYNGKATKKQKDEISKYMYIYQKDLLSGIKNEIHNFYHDEGPLIQQFNDIKKKEKERDTEKFLKKVIFPILKKEEE